MKAGRRGKTCCNGFTVLEAAIATVVAGIMVAAVAEIFLVWHETHKFRVTQERMEKIEALISEYATRTGMAPCPASLTDTPDTATFGQSDNCAAAPAPGLWDIDGRVQGGVPLQVRVGGVPLQTLRATLGKSVGNELALDGWGNRFTYAATVIMASDPVLYAQNIGAISILDTNGNSLTPQAPETAVYALVSHGKDGRGAHTPAGVLHRPCNFTALDGANCDYLDDTNASFAPPFLYSTMSSTSGGNANNDDLLAFSVKARGSGPRIADFTLVPMNCAHTVASGGWVGQVPWGPFFGEACASRRFNLAQASFTPALNALPASNNTLFFQTTFTGAENDVQLYIRATIPARAYDNPVPTNWRPPILAAIYLDNDLIGTGELLNPPDNQLYSAGGTTVIVATNENSTPDLARVNIVRGKQYTLRIYAYTTCPDSGPGSCPNRAATVGTIRHDDHFVTGMVEIMQIEKQNVL